MENKKTALVIGAGIGGLSAAARLAYHGYTVTVIEQRSRTGGKILQLKKNGFTFDAGPSFITLKEIYDDYFTYFGKKREDYIHFTKMAETTTFRFANGKKFTLFTDQQKVRNEIMRLFPGDEDGFDRFMAIAGQIYELLYHGPKYARRNYTDGLNYLLDKDSMNHFFKLHLYENWDAIVRKCFRHSELQAVFSYQATFLGMTPKEALGTFCFFPYAEISDGMYTVKGGIIGIADGFTKLCNEFGVTFRFNTQVKTLTYRDDKVTGVKTDNGNFSADIIISNVDGAYFYTHIMPGEKNKTFTEKKLRQMKHTNSYFTINLGLKKPISGLDHHTLFVPEDWQKFFDIVRTQNSVRNLTPANFCYYAMQSNNTNQAFAPKGKAALFLLTPVCGYDPEMDWASYEQVFKEMWYDIIEQRDGIPIQSLIEEEIIYSPNRWGKEFNLWENSILSFSLNFFQINNFRMPNKSREFTNLYFSGSSTVPGPGIPPCITSGELVTQRIMADYGT